MKRSSIKYNIDSPYKEIEESKKGKVIKNLIINFPDDPKKVWSKFLNENGEKSNTTTDKLSQINIKGIFNDEDDSSSDNTVIENPCENNYDLIYKCLHDE